VEYSALSPTGTAGFHEPMKFAHFYSGRSHRFDVRSQRHRLRSRLPRRCAAAQSSAVSRAGRGEGHRLPESCRAGTSRALRPSGRAGHHRTDPHRRGEEKRRRCSTCWRRPKHPRSSPGSARRISSNWPFWKRGDGYHARGRAYFITKEAEKAEADLTAALPWTSEPRTRDAIHLALAQNREHNLRDDDAALVAYRAIIDGRQQIGGADEFAALQGIARILTRKGRFDEALAILNRANPDKLQGTWRDRILKSIEEVRQARNEGTRP
jgi:hypothetical protein